MRATKTLRPRQSLGKYRIEAKIAEGGFAVVYRAMDTIEGIRVALKIPHDNYVSDAMMEDFRQEIRMIAKLDHPNVLPLKNASMIDGRLVIAFLLGERTLEDRLARRMSLPTCLDYSHQMLKAIAYAHSQRIVHCDIKPPNFIIFPGNVLRLADFGIAKVSRKTVIGSGTGTVGHMAPEQAMGRPSFRSDVFAVGLIMYRMLSGVWPQWPFDWPPAGFERLSRRKVHPDLVKVLRKSLQTDPKLRFVDGGQMLKSFETVVPRSLRYYQSR